MTIHKVGFRWMTAKADPWENGGELELWRKKWARQDKELPASTFLEADRRHGTGEEDGCNQWGWVKMTEPSGPKTTTMRTQTAKYGQASGSTPIWVFLHCDIIIPKSNIYFGQFLYISQTLCIWGCPTLTVVSINLCVTSESSYRIFETLQCLRLAECWDPFLTLPQLFNWSQYFPIRQFAIGNKQPTGRSWLALCHLCLAIGAANQVS